REQPVLVGALRPQLPVHRDGGGDRRRAARGPRRGGTPAAGACGAADGWADGSAGRAPASGRSAGLGARVHDVSADDRRRAHPARRRHRVSREPGRRDAIPAAAHQPADLPPDVRQPRRRISRRRAPQRARVLRRLPSRHDRRRRGPRRRGAPGRNPGVPMKTARLSPRSRGLAGRPLDAAPRPVRCQICGARTVPGVDLGAQPVGDLILSAAQLNQPETFYPMQLHHCVDCGLTQLGYTVNPRVVYKHFPFVSGTTQAATTHLQTLPAQLVSMLRLSRKSFAVDIGSNDGTLLKGYRPSGVRFLGVDPSGDPVRIANAQGIPTLHAFFNDETAAKIGRSRGKATAITACGVFAHIADLDGVMAGVSRLLAPGGVFATDSQYWLDMVLRLHYDNVFHQHLRYYAMRPLTRLFDEYGMDVFDVERSE